MKNLLLLLTCLIAIAILSSCSPKTLYSRIHFKGKTTPWTVDYEGTFEKNTTVFIDSLTGSVEFKYTRKPINSL